MGQEEGWCLTIGPLITTFIAASEEVCRSAPNIHHYSRSQKYFILPFCSHPSLSNRVECAALHSNNDEGESLFFRSQDHCVSPELVANLVIPPTPTLYRFTGD